MICVLLLLEGLIPLAAAEDAEETADLLVGLKNNAGVRSCVLSVPLTGLEDIGLNSVLRCPLLVDVEYCNAELSCMETLEGGAE